MFNRPHYRNDDPPDEPDCYCEICLNFVDDCVCPMCEACGETGNPACIEKHMPIDEWTNSFQERWTNEHRK